MSGTNQSGLLPVRMRSKKTWLIDVFAIPASEQMAAVSMTKAMAGPMPRRRSLA